MSQHLWFRDAVPSWNPSHGGDLRKKSRRRVENIGDGFLRGHDTQPAINVAASSEQRVSRNDLASPSGARCRKVTGGCQLAHRRSIRPMRKRPNHSRLGLAFQLWNVLPPETSPARSAGSLFDSDKRRAMSASLIGRLGSSTFRLSTTAMSMSLAGSCFSSESAPGPFHHGIRGRGGTISTSALPSYRQ